MRVETTSLLRTSGVLSSADYRANLEAARAYQVKPIEALCLSGACDVRTAAAAAARVGCLPWWDKWPPAAIPLQVRNLIPGDIASEHRAVPIRVFSEGDLLIAMVDPLDELACAELEFFAGRGLQRIAVPAPMASNAVYSMYGYETAFRALWSHRRRSTEAASTAQH